MSYTVSLATPTVGTTIGYTPVGGGSMVVLGEVTNLKLGGLSVDKIDTTNFQSLSNRMEKTGGWVDPGEMSGTMHYLKAQTTTLLSTIIRTTYIWTITYPDASTYVCNGFLDKLGQAFDMKKLIDQDFSIALSGKEVYSAGA